jgi:hypothetical protein
MTVLTRRAREVFAPTTSSGQARRPVITHARVWGLEMERGRIAFGSWTPGLTFDTVGDASITLGTATGSYERIGNLYRIGFVVTTSAFTHTTASGPVKITGLPINARVAAYGNLAEIQGVTKANYTRFGVRVADGQSFITLTGSGSGQSVSQVTAADMPTGGSVALRGSVWVEAV